MIVFLSFFILILFYGISDACTTFFVNDSGKLIFGRSYDFDIGDGYVMVNKRNVRKSALGYENSLKWTSMYGSITFNEFGREMPLGGMNEAGLVIENMWLEETIYPQPDDRPEVASLQWIQYQLDTHSTVDEVIKSDSELRISSESAGKLHFLVVDASGDCAVIEFLDGKMVTHRGKDLPYAALTNDTYDKSLDYLSKHEGFGGDKKIPDGPGSFDRFARATSMVANFRDPGYETLIDGAFEILTSVFNKGHSRWNIVYDISDGIVEFRTDTNPEIRCFDAKSFDYSCKSDVLVLDINSDLKGDVTGKFIPYTPELNRDLVFKVYKNVSFLKDTPDPILEFIAAYPESTVCVE